MDHPKYRELLDYLIMAVDNGDTPKLDPSDLETLRGIRALCNPPDPIIVAMEGGAVQSVENIPAGHSIHIRDYDCPADWEGGQTDENGDTYEQLEWGS